MRPDSDLTDQLARWHQLGADLCQQVAVASALMADELPCAIADRLGMHLGEVLEVQQSIQEGMELPALRYLTQGLIPFVEANFQRQKAYEKRALEDHVHRLERRLANLDYASRRPESKKLGLQRKRT